MRRRGVLLRDQGVRRRREPRGKVLFPARCTSTAPATPATSATISVYLSLAFFILLCRGEMRLFFGPPIFFGRLPTTVVMRDHKNEKRLTKQQQQQQQGTQAGRDRRQREQHLALPASRVHDVCLYVSRAAVWVMEQQLARRKQSYVGTAVDKNNLPYADEPSPLGNIEPKYVGR